MVAGGPWKSLGSRESRGVLLFIAVLLSLFLAPANLAGSLATAICGWMSAVVAAVVVDIASFLNSHALLASLELGPLNFRASVPLRGVLLRIAENRWTMLLLCCSLVHSVVAGGCLKIAGFRCCFAVHWCTPLLQAAA